MDDISKQRIETFNTPRLTATCFSQGDFETLCHLHQDPKVMATLGGVRSDEETRRFLQEKLAHWEAHGFGYWLFHQRTDGQFVGRGGLQYIEIEGQIEVEVGYTVSSAFWGQGFATEMAQAMVRLGFEQLGLTNIVCLTLTTNHASRRVMAKVGFSFERNFIHGDQPHVLYRLIVE